MHLQTDKLRGQSRWSIFEKRGKDWIRMSNKSYFKTTAQMVWFDTLIEPYTKPENCKGERKLRKVVH
jgi:hypothetical protein